jgi:CubicO group peptidase (beta-lactamase class C family)
MHTQGYCDPQFEKVKRAFEDNFKLRGDVGASVAIYKDGERRVELWGGDFGPDEHQAWTQETLVNIWSTTKGVTAACFAIAVFRGVIAYDDKVVDYWPEFGRAGKETVTVAMLLSHQAGLCGLKDPTTLDDVLNIERFAAKLADAAPFWRPGKNFGYHAITLGALASELFKRAEGRSIAQFVEDEMRQQLGLDIFIGAPDAELLRVSPVWAPTELASDSFAQEFTPVQISAFANPHIEPAIANTAAWRKAEIPSANGHATAKALAKLYSALASAGELDGKSIVSKDVLTEATRPQIEGIDAVLSIDARWGCGFLLNTNGLYGPNPQSFGHSGWGGSFAFGDPAIGLGVAYTMNQMGTDLVGDPRNTALIDAVYASIPKI